MMAKVVPAEFRDIGAFEKRRPRGLEAGSRFKEPSSTVGLFAPTFEYTSGLLIQANVTSLATLGSSAFDGEDPPLEVNAIPTQCQKLTASKSGVHGEQYRRRQVVPKVWQGRKQLILALLPPRVG